jgi:hypothetical protein
MDKRRKTMPEQARILLRGGLGTRDAQRSGQPSKIVVVSNGGHERFEHSGEYCEVDGEQVAVFQWCYRTTIAE